MRIVNREEFLKLPAYTLYAKCSHSWLEELQIKGDSTEVDFCSTNFKNFDFGDARELNKKFDEMINEKKEYPVAPWEDCGRDGLFDEDQLFMIYDKKDIKKIIEALQECLDDNLKNNETSI